MSKGQGSNILLGLVLLGVGLVAGLLIARPSAVGSPSPKAEPERNPEPEPVTPAEPAAAEDTARRLEMLEEWVADARHEIAALRHEVEPVGPLLELLREARPRLEAARRLANQVGAVASLRNIVSAQAQFQASGKVDVDNDGIGEHGGLKELSGAALGRMAYRLRPQVLSDVFGRLDENGEASRGGYRYRVYLPDGDGVGVGEPQGGFQDDGTIDPDAAERVWCCYAWPEQAGATAQATYFVNQRGEVLGTKDERYAGPGGGPKPDAAYREAGGLLGEVALDTRGQDGNTWELQD